MSSRRRRRRLGIVRFLVEIEKGGWCFDGRNDLKHGHECIARGWYFVRTVARSALLVGIQRCFRHYADM